MNVYESVPTCTNVYEDVRSCVALCERPYAVWLVPRRSLAIQACSEQPSGEIAADGGVTTGIQGHAGERERASQLFRAGREQCGGQAVGQSGGMGGKRSDGILRRRIRSPWCAMRGTRLRLPAPALEGGRRPARELAPTGPSLIRACKPMWLRSVGRAGHQWH